MGGGGDERSLFLYCELQCSQKQLSLGDSSSWTVYWCVLTLRPQVASEDAGLPLEEMDTLHLGTCKKVIITKDDTLFLEGAGTREG